MKTLLLLLFFCISIVNVSCVSEKKMAAARERLNKIKEAQKREVTQIKQLSSARSTRMKESKIDSVINKRIDFRVGTINLELDTAEAQIRELDSLMADERTFRRSYNNLIIPKLELLDSFRAENTRRMQVYLMLEDGLNTANYTLFDLAAFFGPGKYAIPGDKEAIVIKSFEPLIDSVIKFSEKYSNLSQTATLVILGFADATGFDPKSPLYGELAAKIGKQVISKQELNKKLSELRAQSLIKMLHNQFAKKMKNHEASDKFNIEFIGLGKGEFYPFLSINDYKEDDERRRIVLCYWAVLPK